MSEDDRLLATWQGLYKLEQYFGGKNEQGAAMNLTWPMLQQFKHGRHPGVLRRELRDITLSVPLPARYQLSPPAPLTDEVIRLQVERVVLNVLNWFHWFHWFEGAAGHGGGVDAVRAQLPGETVGAERARPP